MSARRSVGLLSLMVLAAGLTACPSLPDPTPHETPDAGEGATPTPEMTVAPSVDSGPTAPVDAAPAGPTGPAQASISEAALAFEGACGQPAPAAKKLTITNLGGDPLQYNASFGSSSFTITGASSGTIAGGGTATLTIAASAVPSTATAGAITTAALTITTNDVAKSVVQIPVSMTASGASIQVLPQIADFGQFPLGAQAPNAALTITNNGNAAAEITFTQPSNPDFALDYTGVPDAGPLTATIAPGASLAGAVARFRPSSLAQATSSAGIAVSGAVCSGSATSLTMTGHGTSGVIGIAPATLDFGSTSCGATGVPLSFTIVNAGNASFTWSSALGKGADSPYVLSATSGIVLASSQLQITVTPRAVPQTSAITPNLYGDTLTITTNVDGDEPHTVNLLQTAKGAILGLTASSFEFAQQETFTTSAAKPLGIVNTGNAPATIRLASSGGTSSSFRFLPAGANTVAGGATLSGDVSFTPQQFGALAETVAVTTSDVLCQPLPEGATLTGTSRAIATAVSVGGGGRRERSSASSACAIIAGGHVACWGNAANGKLGQGAGEAAGDGNPTLVHTTTGLLSGVTTLSSGAQYHCALLKTGTVSCWGNISGGVPGSLNSPSPQSYAVPVPGISGATGIAADHRTLCILVPTGNGGENGSTVRCSGSNRNSQLAGNSITDAVSVAMGSSVGCVTRMDGTVSCWGANSKGQIGNGTRGGLSEPSTVTALSSPLRVEGGGGGGRSSHVCALLADHTVSCWGDAAHGKMGTGTDERGSQTTPLPVPGLANVTALALGARHVCAVSDGSVSCWGNNQEGQIGNATTTDALSPVTLAGISTATDISAGGASTCALLASGSVTCWGGLGGAATPQPVQGF